MNCPECGNEMEAEPVREVVNIAIPEEIRRDGSISEAHNGTLGGTVYHFRCENCDSEWEMRRRKLRQLDGAAFARPLDQLIKKENYR